MALYFSPSTIAFYDTKITQKAPEDAIEVKREDFDALMAAQRDGKNIVAGDGGKPVAINRVQTDQERRAILIASAKLALAASDLVAMRCVKAGVQYPAEWLARDIALRNIVNGTDVQSTEIPAAPVSFPSGT